MKMNSSNPTSPHIYQLIMLIMLFIVLLVAAAWMYNMQISKVMMEEEQPTPVTKEDLEKIYGQEGVKMSTGEKATIESIYGN